MTTENNPLLELAAQVSHGTLPRYDAVLPEHVAPAIDQLLEENRNLIKQMEDLQDTPCWDNFVTPMGICGQKLSAAWGVINHMHHVVDNPALREAYNAALPKLSEFWSSVGQNLKLYEKYKALQSAPGFADQSPARKTIVEHELRGFRLGGAELADKEKERFSEIDEQLSQLTSKFAQNVLDATNDFVYLVEDEARLAGLPEDAKQAARASAEQAGKSGWLFTLHHPSLFPVLQFAADRSLRETVYLANCTRASDQGTVFSKNAEWDNTPIMLDILRLRKEKAQLLGYQNYAQLSLVPKMADTPQQVLDFLQDLAKRALPYARRDWQEVCEFARKELGIEDLQAWDVAYASEKLREQRYAFSSQEVKQYFREDRVLQGLFDVLQSLFQVTLREDQAPLWHPDVKFFRIERDGQLIGQFYLDLYARSGKRGGAWMDSARPRHLHAHGLQTPVAYLVCNFTPPAVVDGVQQPVLLTHGEVTTLFHEFGHGIHHLLTRVDDMEVAGISGVEWDAVELPSQMMENFCWDWEVLQGMTSHIETGASLPRALYDKMLAAKNFQAGMGTVRQLEFALMDMRLHGEATYESGAQIQQMVDALRQEVAVIIPPACNRFQHAFSHIFAGGYAAGYYSYKWAEVLSADAFAAFEEQAEQSGSVLKGEAGPRFLQEVLAMGSVRPALESFKAFRGRAPSLDALLRHNGMDQDLAAA